MIAKRDTFPGVAATTEPPSAFIKQYLEDLETLAGRQRYFVDYEFPKK